MIRKPVFFAAGFALLAGAAGLAIADDSGRSNDDGGHGYSRSIDGAAAPVTWMPIGELAAKLETQGYTVREIERDDGVYEVEATDANGQRVEAYLDPATGEPIRGWRHDD